MQVELAPTPLESLSFDAPNQELVGFSAENEFMGEPSGWRIVREKFPEKYENYTITNVMHSYLLNLGNEKLYGQVMVAPERVMIPSKSGRYVYPYLPGTTHFQQPRKTEKTKAISKILKRMLDMQVTAKNPFTKKNETLTYEEHAAIAILAGAVKDRNFRHLNMLLERTEGKVAEEINGNLTMGLASALKLISKEDDAGADDDNDADRGELIENDAD